MKRMGNKQLAAQETLKSPNLKSVFQKSPSTVVTGATSLLSVKTSTVLSDVEVSGVSSTVRAFGS